LYGGLITDEQIGCMEHHRWSKATNLSFPVQRHLAQKFDLL
jgi:hypothetical protein